MPKRKAAHTDTDESSRIHTGSSITDLFVPSDTPVEEWSDGDTEEWPISKIVEEDIDIFGRKHMQAEWENWTRKSDGTNTTWQREFSGDNTVKVTWRANRGRERHAEARASENIDLFKLLDFMPHQLHTAEDAVAFAEKKRLCKAPVVDWDPETRQTLRAPTSSTSSSSIPHPTRSAKRVHQALSTPSSDTSLRERKAPVTPGPSQQKQSSSRQFGKEPDRSRLRDQVQKKWDENIRAAGAAQVTLVNDVDDEEIPNLGANFRYMEDKFVFDDDVPQMDPAFLSGCECEDGCTNALRCPCVADSECVDEYDNVTAPYTEMGRLRFANNQEVIECNLNCTCRKCKNRVAQKPRRTPMQVFKTRSNGWGVRTVADVSMGTVLGSYTGKIMTRERHSKLSPGTGEYSFDLDLRDGDSRLEQRYTVTAFSEGNWTRFVNHSCDPTAMVYSAVINKPANANMPQIVFVASKDIRAGEEITIDYNPAARRDLGKKGKKKVAGETKCMCESDLCRGYI